MGPRTGSQALNSTWQVLWDNGRRIEGTRYISLADCHSKAVALIFVRIEG